MTSKSTQYSSLLYARCFLLFQLNNQPGPLLLDVKKVGIRTLPRFHKNLFRQILSLIVTRIILDPPFRFRRGFLDIRRNIERRLAFPLLGKNAQGAQKNFGSTRPWPPSGLHGLWWDHGALWGFGWVHSGTLQGGTAEKNVTLFHHSRGVPTGILHV